MTSEEALKIIGRFMPNEVINSTKKLDALMVGMKAIEKQIPKEPKGKYADICECGNVIFSNMRYCPKCGQALNWGGVKNDN